MVTMRDVAQAAGVSTATVSMALRGDRRIAAQTRLAVREAADRLGYATNLSARSLRSGHAGVLGLMLLDLDIPQPMQIASAFGDAAAAVGMQSIVQQVRHGTVGTRVALERAASQLCDGMLVATYEPVTLLVSERDQGRPMVLLDDEAAPSNDMDAVLTPSFDGAEMAVTHLLASGCRSIVVLGSQFDVASDPGHRNRAEVRRLQGCMSGFSKAGRSLDPGHVIPARWDGGDAVEVVSGLVRAGMEFDGLFCMTDVLAIGAMRGLSACGLRVPEDVKVMGFDGITVGGLCSPSLSTIAVDCADLAAKAVDRLMLRIEHPREAIAPVALTAEHHLVVRESTAH